MNDWAMYKPVLTALVLPPVPLLMLVWLGAWLIRRHRGLGYATVLTATLGFWLCACQGTATWLQEGVLRPGPPLPGHEFDRLAQAARGDAVAPRVAIMVLGAGRDAVAAEYAGAADLSESSAERLRYGIWLSRRTGVPLGFSGGVGWSQKVSGSEVSEAEVAGLIAREQFGHPLRWVESASSDTRGNAARSIEMLSAQGVREVVVVTQAFHMPRARRAFEEAAMKVAEARPDSFRIKVTPAPIDYWGPAERPMLGWLPSANGMLNVHTALREWLGRLVGA